VPVAEARFPRPTASQKAGHDAALLLRDALVLSLRRGAGPSAASGRSPSSRAPTSSCRCSWRSSSTPCGCSSPTTSASARPSRPPSSPASCSTAATSNASPCSARRTSSTSGSPSSRTRFHLRPSRSPRERRAARAQPPAGREHLHAHPHTVVSLDYIKSERAPRDFLRACPDFVIVDEAHTCASQRARAATSATNCSRGLADDPARHLVLLTATPHSGDEGPSSASSGSSTRLRGAARPRRRRARALRERLAAHFVQRRRPDIAEWKEGELFPRRETTELTYKLTARGRRSSTPCSTTAPPSSPAAEDDEEAAAQLLGHAGAHALRSVEPDGRRPGAPHPRGRGSTTPTRARTSTRAACSTAPPTRSWTTTSSRPPPPTTRRSPRSSRRPRARGPGGRSEAQAPHRARRRAGEGGLQPGGVLPLHRHGALPRAAPREAQERHGGRSSRAS
jgi:hypothetical protein